MVSRTFLWHDIRTFAGSQETFCDACGSQFNISSGMDTVEVLQKFLDLTFAIH